MTNKEKELYIYLYNSGDGFKISEIASFMGVENITVYKAVRSLNGISTDRSNSMADVCIE